MIMIINLQYNGKDNEHNNYGKIDCGVFKVAREELSDSNNKCRIVSEDELVKILNSELL